MITTISYGYADESGDGGYDFERSASARFVMGIVLPEKPEQTIDRILAIRRALNKSAVYEFHFRQADARVRTRFFTDIQTEPIKIIVAVLHKKFAPTDFRRLGKLGIYSHALAGLGLRASFPLNKCKLHLDGSGKQKDFLQTLRTNIRWTCRAAGRPQQNFKDIRMLESAHPLIQYADMVTGAVAAHVSGQDTRWFNMISSQIDILWHERFEKDTED